MMTLAIAAHFPHLPPTPKPLGGPVPDRTPTINWTPRHLHGVEAKRERSRRKGAR